MRPHEDLEFAIPRPRFVAVAAAFERYALFAAGAGAIRPVRDGAVHPEIHQVWVAETAVPAYRTDIFLEPGDDETWVCRRNEKITQPLADVVGRTAAGVPFLKPAYVLLYKAKGMRAKDLADFATIVPDLSRSDREWLAGALEVAHPGHPWIEELTRAG
jgi:hypothetical protein